MNRKNFAILCLQIVKAIQVTLNSGSILTGYVEDQYFEQTRHQDLESYFSNQHGVSSQISSRYRGQKFPKIDIYRGIPYGQADRFEKPKFVDYSSAPQTLNCTTAAPICIQNEYMLIDDLFGEDMSYWGNNWKNPATSENCLTLDIYVPENLSNEASKKPVVIFIHGGTYVQGSSQESDGRFLAALNDFIVVNIQYRLSVLGFYTENTERNSGNYGLWDQRLAIEWVQHEIASFGGNPEDITLIGESAGSGSVEAQFLYEIKLRLQGQPQTFRKTINMSGHVLDPWSIKPRWKLDIWFNLTDTYLQHYNVNDYLTQVDGKLDSTDPQKRSQITNYLKNLSESDLLLLENDPDFFAGSQPWEKTNQGKAITPFKMGPV